MDTIIIKYLHINRISELNNRLAIDKQINITTSIELSQGWLRRYQLVYYSWNNKMVNGMSKNSIN